MKQMRKIASYALCASLIWGAGTLLPARAQQQFSDVEGHWAETALLTAAENDLLQGYNGKLMPDGLLTRGELAAVITRAVQAEETADLSAFLDVPATAWYAESMSKAYAMGVLQGSGSFLRPADTITRQETFAVVARLLALEPGNGDELSRFADGGEVADWAKDDVCAAIHAGLVSGGDTGLKPLDPITRAEFVTVMQLAIDTYLHAEESAVITQVDGQNVMLTGRNVTLRNVTISGDLYLGDGIEDGSIALENVTVKGRLVMRGGGSLLLTGGSQVQGKTVVLSDEQPTVTVDKEASLADAELQGEDITFVCSRDVSDLTVTGNGAKITAPQETKVRVDQGVLDTVVNGKSVEGGSTVTGGQTTKPGSGNGSHTGGGESESSIRTYTYDEVKSSFSNQGAQGTVKQYVTFLTDPSYGTGNDAAFDALDLANTETFVNKDFTLEPSLFPSLRNVAASYLTEDRDELWMAYEDGGVDCLHLESEKVDHYDAAALTAGRPLLLVYDESNELTYLITEEGVTRIDP